MTEIDKLWIKYSKTKDFEIRQTLIVNYLSLVKFVAGRVSLQVGNYIEYDDLVSFGTFGLIDAIDKYDYSLGNKFETYASLRIRGAILDNIRKQDWVPRSIRQKTKQLQNAYVQFENEHGRDPSDKELAAMLGMTVEQVDEVLAKTKINNFISLDEYVEQNNDELPNSSSIRQLNLPEKELDKKEMIKELSAAIEKLTEKEKYVVSLYYFDDLTLKEISKVLEVSESRVSQIHSKALFKLENKLTNYKKSMF